ncbi:MAG: hypothetical protein Q8Q62_01860 [Mesorhizobium sp.]|nr:hypothetical protein [Mesorhizobium sp.]
MTIRERIGSGWRGARWLLLIGAVFAVTLAGLTIAPSPACRPIVESEAARLKEGEIPLLRWITDTMGAAVGYPLSFIRWRRGYLEDEAAFRNRLAGILQPLDVIVVKNGYKVTDAIIPGIFTHAAIWLGDEVSLRRVGLWDHPDVAPLQERIAQGMR